MADGSCLRSLFDAVLLRELGEFHEKGYLGSRFRGTRTVLYGPVRIVTNSIYIVDCIRAISEPYDECGR